MPHEFVVTAVGPDRPGIASDVAGCVHAAGASLADTRMVNLRGQFALIALVEGSAEALRDAAHRLIDAGPPMGLAIGVTTPSPRALARPRRAGVAFRLKTYSMDKPGIVHRIASYLRDCEVNVEELVTRLESAPFMGSPIFTMEALLFVPEGVNVRQFRRSLEELGDALNCAVDLAPA